MSDDTDPKVEPSAADADAKRHAPRWVLPVAFFVGGALITAGVVALLLNITQRKNEAQQPYFQVVQPTDTSFDPRSGARTSPSSTRAGRTPRSMRSRPRHARPPRRTPRRQPMCPPASSRLIRVWSPCGRATPSRWSTTSPRGHAYMLSDQMQVKRVQALKQPGACLNCHASIPEVRTTSAETLEHRLGDHEQDAVLGRGGLGQAPCLVHRLP